MKFLLVLLHPIAYVVARPTRFLAVRPVMIANPPTLPEGLPLPLPFFNGFGASTQSVPMGLADMLRDVNEPAPIEGHSEQFSKSITTKIGDDGRKHKYEISTRCIDGNCTKTEEEIQADNLPTQPESLADSAFQGDLDQLLEHFFEHPMGERAVMPRVESLRFELRPDHKFSVARLERSKGNDGSEVVHGDLPKGLNASSLFVEQHGPTVSIRYPANHTINGNQQVRVEQRVRLGFQPAKKEKAHYNPDTGYFQMTFPRPESDTFDPKVELVIGSDDSQTKPPIESKVQQRDAPIIAKIINGRNSGEGDGSKPAVLLEVGAESEEL